MTGIDDRSHPRPLRSRAGRVATLGLGIALALCALPSPADAAASAGGPHLWHRDVDRVGSYRPVSGDFDGDGHVDIFWYGPGGVVDEVEYSGPAPATGVWTLTGTFQPFVGDFNGDGRDDVYFYAPGPAADYLWYGNGRGSFKSRRIDVSGTYTPVVGRFTSDRTDDIVWYAPGHAADAFWDFELDGTITKSARTINGNYRPLVANLSETVDGVPFKGIDDIFWTAVDPAGISSRWLIRSDASYSAASVSGVGGRIPTFVPLASAFIKDCGKPISTPPGVSVPQYCFMRPDLTKAVRPTILFSAPGMADTVRAFSGNSVSWWTIGESKFVNGGTRIPIMEPTGAMTYGIFDYVPWGIERSYNCTSPTSCPSTSEGADVLGTGYRVLRWGRGGGQAVLFHPSRPDMVVV